MIHFDRRYVFIPVLAAVVLVVAGYVSNELSRNTLIDAVKEIQLSQERNRLLVDVLSLVTDAETSQRGFVLTGDESYLDPYERTKREISGYLTLVQRSYGTPSHPEMQAKAARVIELCAAKLTELDAAIQLSKQGQRQALSLFRTKIGQEKMEALRELVSEMRASERSFVVRMTDSWLRTHQTQRIMYSIGTALNVVLIVLTGVLVTREIRRRTDVARELESQIDQKTRELSELSTHLQKVSETEKFALARELHDELGGLLIAIKMDLAQLRTRFDLSQPDIQKRWERMQAALSAGIDLKRRIIEQLRPSLLDNMGLIAAIRWQASEITGAAGLRLDESYIDIEPSINGDAAIAIFRIVQESLTNVVKHARATRVGVEVQLTKTEFQLSIEDNGVGIGEGSATKVSHGINSMRHRLTPFDGELAIERVEPSGTRVRVTIPLSTIELATAEEAA